MRINRRELLKNAGLASGALLVGSCRSASQSFARETLPLLPSPETTGIAHIVVLTMENRRLFVDTHSPHEAQSPAGLLRIWGPAMQAQT